MGRLVVEDLSLAYRYENGQREICSRVSFEVEAGEILGIFGPNGCGKSTLLRAIAGLHENRRGQVRIAEKVGEAPPLAMIPQDYRASFFDWLNLRHNLIIAMPNILARRRQNARLVESTHASMGLELDLSLRPPQCSGGMVQQAAIIRALAREPSALIADEPFSALDVEIAAKVRRAFCRAVAQRGIATVMVLHDLEDIVEVCDRVLVIPGRPYSSIDSQRHAQVHILDNARRDQRYDTNTPSSFLDLARRVLTGS